MARSSRGKVVSELMPKLAFHKGTGVIATAIKWQSRGPYSHVSIILDSGRIVEAREFKGVQILDSYDGCREEIDIYDITSPLPKLDVANMWLLQQVGKSYDYSSVARFISRRQESRTGSGKWFCSELGFAYVQQCGVNLLARAEPWMIDPNKLNLSPLLKYGKTLNQKSPVPLLRMFLAPCYGV